MPLTLEVSVSTLSLLDMVRVHAGAAWHDVPWAGRVLPHTVEGVLMTCSDLRQPLRRVPSFIDWNCVVRRLTCGMPSRDNAVQPRRGADAPAGVEARDWKPTRPWKRRVAENALAGEERDGPRWPCALVYGAGVWMTPRLNRCILGVLGSSMTGSRMQLCMTDTWMLPLTKRCRSLGPTMLAGMCEDERLEQLLERLSNTCGVLALFANKCNALIVVKHATSIATGTTAKIGYRAGHGARIGSTPWPRKASSLREWARMSAA